MLGGQNAGHYAKRVVEARAHNSTIERILTKNAYTTTLIYTTERADPKKYRFEAAATAAADAAIAAIAVVVVVGTDAPQRTTCWWSARVLRA